MCPAAPCLQHHSVYGQKIVFRLVRHEDSVEMIVERDGEVGAGSAIASSSLLLVTGIALSSFLSSHVSLS